MKKEILIRHMKKDIAKCFNLTPPAVVLWFSKDNPTMPTADKVSTLYKKFGIPVDYWAQPELYEIKFIPKKRAITRRQRKDNGNTKVWYF